MPRRTPWLTRVKFAPPRNRVSPKRTTKHNAIENNESAAAPDAGGPRWEMRILLLYAGLDPENPPQTFTRELHEGLLRALFHSNSWLAVAMITDLFGRSERFNYPGVAGNRRRTSPGSVNGTSQPRTQFVRRRAGA